MTPGNNKTEVARVLEDVAEIRPGWDTNLLKHYLEELFKWNSQIGLVSKKDSAKTVTRLIRLSISLWDYTEQTSGLLKESSATRFLDIGTGGGFPGLIWKMIKPGLEGCLVERKDRKVQFLERVIRNAGWSGLQAVAADVEDLYQNPDYREAFSLVTMLAVKPPPVLAHIIETFLEPNGYFSTVRSRSQKIIEDRIGDNLVLQNALTSDEGIFVLYRKK